MSHKAPKNYNKGVARSQKSTATAEEERQAKRIIGGIAVALIVIMLAAVAVYKFFEL